MTETEMLDWIDEHLAGFRHTMRDALPYEMSWIDDNGIEKVTFGNNIRDCVDYAVNPNKETK